MFYSNSFKVQINRIPYKNLLWKLSLKVSKVSIKMQKKNIKYTKIIGKNKTERFTWIPARDDRETGFFLSFSLSLFAAVVLAAKSPFPPFPAINLPIKIISNFQKQTNKKVIMVEGIQERQQILLDKSIRNRIWN